MNVLTQEQTSAAVRAMIYFGAHDFNGAMDLRDCKAVLSSELETASPPTNDKNDPVEEKVRVMFKDVEVNGAPVKGVIKVETKIRWATLYERLRVGSPNFSISAQPTVIHEGLTKNCLIAWSRLIKKHADEVDTFKAHTDDAPDQEKSSDDDAA